MEANKTKKNVFNTHYHCRSIRKSNYISQVISKLNRFVFSR